MKINQGIAKRVLRVTFGPTADENRLIRTLMALNFLWHIFSINHAETLVSARIYVRNLEISEIGVSRFVVIYFFHKVYIMYAVGCIGFREDILRFIFEAWLFMA